MGGLQVSCEGHQKEKRERLFRYIARPAVAIPRLSLSCTGKVIYTLKTPYRDGTTQVAFDPVDFIARRQDRQMLWIFQDRRSRRWYVHGVFA